MRVAVEPILLACCAVEVATALQRGCDRNELHVVDSGDAPDATVVVIAGTITHDTWPLIRERIAAVRGPCSVIAYGVCASSGGPYWDSHAVVQGCPDADLFVPGCPPPADVLWGAISEAARRAVAHAAG